MKACMYPWIHKHIQMINVHTYTYAYTYSHTHTHAHAHTHTHTHRKVGVVLLASRCRSKSILIHETMCVYIHIYQCSRARRMNIGSKMHENSVSVMKGTTGNHLRGDAPKPMKLQVSDCVVTVPAYTVTPGRLPWVLCSYSVTVVRDTVESL
jgi:hypothetical protein